MATNSKLIASKTRYELWGVILVSAAVLLIMSLFDLNVGIVGIFLRKLQLNLFGIGSYLVPAVLLLIGLKYIYTGKAVIYSARFVWFNVIGVVLLSIYHHAVTIPGREILPESLTRGGGLLAGFILFMLRKVFGVDGTLLVLVALGVAALLMATSWSLSSMLHSMKERSCKLAGSARESLAHGRDTAIDDTDCRYEQAAVQTDAEDSDWDDDFVGEDEGTDLRLESAFYDQAGESEPDERGGNFALAEPVKEYLPAGEPAAATALEWRDGAAAEYKLPAVSAILQKKSKTQSSKMASEIADNARVLEATLDSFNVKVKIIDVCKGPTVTRYELQPAPGVKVSKIVNLADDLAMSLAAPGVRIEAPIPGKPAVGIEVPNREMAGVQLVEVLESADFKNAKSKLSVGLGIDIGGKPIIADLAKMPHLLVAGATGSGKSVCVNTIIASILFKARPDEVKFILIDPKMVELSNYNGIPHLMVPVVTDAKKAASVLNWAVREMEHRYTLFAENGVRDMERYNRAVEQLYRMASIVIIIDELADLMMVAPVDVEDAICRLAQKARAAGIHLLLATQRPSVDVITGIIKANIPSRISFSVSSQIDSRTILDMAGAEKLLGKGDMLYYPIGMAKPVRVQGAFISDDEVEKLIAYLKLQGQAEPNKDIIEFTERQSDSKDSGKDSDDQDPLLPDAIKLVFEAKQASTSMLQRRFRVGYTRAARLVDTMELMGIVGPNAGSKAREIIMTWEQVENTYFNKQNTV